MKSKSEVLAQFKKHKQLARGRLLDQYSAFRRADAAYNANVAELNGNIDLTDRNGNKRTVNVQFNKIKPYVMAVKGFFAQNRRKAEYVARVLDNEEQQAKSEYFNSLADYARDNGNADQIETHQDGDMLVRGLGAVDTDVTYGDGLSARNPNGEIEWMRLDAQMVGWNPSARSTNLLDSDFVYYYRDYDKDEAFELFDDIDEKDFSEVEQEPVEVGQRLPGTTIRELVEISDVDDKKARIYFYQWYEVESFWRCENPLRQIADPVLGQIMMMRMQEIGAEYAEYQDSVFAFDPTAEVLTVDADIKAKLTEAFDGVNIDFIKHKRRCYYRAVISGETVFRVRKSPCQNGFTVKFKTGDWDESRKLWVGLVAQMVEPWLYYNKALTELLYAIAAGAKGGVMYEESAVDDVAAFEASYARTDSATRVNDGALSGGKIAPKREAYSPNGVEELISLSDGAINAAAGIDKTFLGSAENKLETAALQRQRIKQVTTTLACYVDAIWLYQKENARLLIDLLRIYAENNDGMMFRVLEQETGRTINDIVSASRLAQEYDITITEGPESATEREERATILSSMGDRLIAAGDVASAKQIYATALKYLPLDMTDKQKLQRVLVPEQDQVDPAQFAAMQQQLERLMSAANEAQLRKIQSDTALNLAKVEETTASIRNKNADSIKKSAEAEQTDVETDLIVRGAGNNARVVI